MKKLLALLIVLATVLVPFAAVAEEPVTIKYWQYFYESKVRGVT